MNDRPFCSVVIPAFNEEQDIEASLSSLVSQSYPRDRYEIIVVDNGSTDRTSEIASAFADLILSRPDGNVGAVRNFGIASASGEIIICTDADCVVTEDWIETGVNLLEKNPNHALGGGLRPRKNARWVEKYWLLNEAGDKTQQRALAGSSIFIWKRDFEHLGTFNESVTSGEDSDLHNRALSNGLKVIIDPKLSVAHLGCPETPRDFIRRQVWHSENYIPDFKNSLKDKVFWLTLLYLGCLTAALFLLFTANYFTAALLLAGAQLSALVLALKRIKRSAWRIKSVNEIGKILLIDNFYLVGRSIGLIKGFRKRSKPARRPVP
ncbi:MAG: glycosyltransferase [Marinobacter sp.]|jgi:glycosyltransferase involved in cell wall biosynthesis|nr:glycosyltransferase [Marinobacter sp.]